MIIKDITVSFDETHHLYKGKPLYESRYINVIKFHPPGLAPVLDIDGAYHIHTDGSPAYSQRHRRTFGYYQERATIVNEDNWFHILPDGSRISDHNYLWCGNFQYNRCAVKDNNNKYFHIDLNGQIVYSQKYNYAGDFKDDIAVVYNNTGASHINKYGELTHGKYFLYLDIYHKSFARACDEKGWFHINKSGNELYSHRFKSTEVFYNGYSFSETLDGRKVIIDETGQTINRIY